MAVKLDVGKQLACKIVDLRSIRRQEKKRLNKVAAVKDAKSVRHSSIASIKSKRHNSDIAKRKVEESVNKIAREVEILKDVRHVSLHEQQIPKITIPPCLSFNPISECIS